MHTGAVLTYPTLKGTDMLFNIQQRRTIRTYNIKISVMEMRIRAVLTFLKLDVT